MFARRLAQSEESHEAKLASKRKTLRKLGRLIGSKDAENEALNSRLATLQAAVAERRRIYEVQVCLFAIFMGTSSLLRCCCGGGLVLSAAQATLVEFARLSRRAFCPALSAFRRHGDMPSRVRRSGSRRWRGGGRWWTWPRPKRPTSACWRRKWTGCERAPSPPLPSRTAASKIGVSSSSSLSCWVPATAHVFFKTNLYKFCLLFNFSWRYVASSSAPAPFLR